MNYEQANAVKELAAPVNKVLEGLGWKWQPKRFELYFDRRTNLIYSFLQEDKTSSRHLWGTCGWTPEKLPKEEIIPILGWEVIEEVLEKAGYWLVTNRPYWKDKPGVQCLLYRRNESDYFICNWGKSRQEAVYRAVIELGKEIKQ